MDSHKKGIRSSNVELLLCKGLNPVRFEIRRCTEWPHDKPSRELNKAAAWPCPGSSDLVSKVVTAISFPLECKGLGRQKVEPNVTKSIPPAADTVHLFLHRQRL